MDKTDTSTTSPGFFYYRRFLGQRLKLNVLNGVEVNQKSTVQMHQHILRDR